MFLIAATTTPLKGNKVRSKTFLYLFFRKPFKTDEYGKENFYIE